MENIHVHTAVDDSNVLLARKVNMARKANMVKKVNTAREAAN